jgi:hypothetical protein
MEFILNHIRKTQQNQKGKKKMEFIRPDSQLNVGDKIYDPAFPYANPEVIHSVSDTEISFGARVWPISYFIRTACSCNWLIES